MESLANYGSEDEQDSDFGHKFTEALTASEQRCNKSRTDDTNYEAVGMDLSEDSNNVNDSEELVSSPAGNPNVKSSQLKDKHLSVEEHRTADYHKEDKERNRPKDRYRDYYKEERNRERDRRKDYRPRKEYRRDRDDYRDRDRDDYRDRDRDDYRERDREREYKNRTERNYSNESSSFRDRYRRSPSPRNRKERKRHQSRSKSRERNFGVRSSTDNSSNDKARDHEHKTVTQSNPSPIATSSKDVKSTSVPENKPNTSVTLPSYYNPNVINPNKYAEQVQKRKLLWSNKKTEDTAGKWENAKFAQDTDGKVASKFMRLMGIKSAPKSDEEGTTVTSNSSESIKKREEMFSSMEQQYEVARQVTHTMRGVGLGFSSQSRQF